MLLNINKVVSSSGASLPFQNFHPNGVSKSIGDGLAIALEDNCKKDSFIDIHYSIGSNPIGLHFSTSIVLEDKRFGYLCTHGEAIYSRSYFPSQDTPSLKVTSEATIRVKKPYSVMFSGILQGVKEIKSDGSIVKRVESAKEVNKEATKDKEIEKKKIEVIKPVVKVTSELVPISTSVTALSSNENQNKNLKSRFKEVQQPTISTDKKTSKTQETVAQIAELQDFLEYQFKMEL